MIGAIENFKRDCPKLIAKNKESQGNIYYLETCFIADSNGSKIVNSSAFNHVCNSLQGFQDTRILYEGEINLWMGIRGLASTITIGHLKLTFVGLPFSFERLLLCARF